MKKVKIVILRDSKGPKSGFLLSGKTYNVDVSYAKKLIKERRAKLYGKETAKRIVNLDGREMTWSEYLKYRRSQK